MSKFSYFVPSPLWRGFCFILMFTFFPVKVFSADSFSSDSKLNIWLKEVENLNLYEDRTWLKLLLYPDVWHGGRKSLVDSKSFFLSHNGNIDPKSEMIATLRAFLSNQNIEANEEEILKTHALCRFPARFFYLKDKLNWHDEDFPAVKCPMLDKFRGFLDYESVSVVFSSYYSGNPASMHGHSFLRLHRKREAEDSGLLRTALLDDAFNFSAFVDTNNPIIYPIKGLFGMFVGRFSLLPYHQKIQEYNNIESRDLWEYELKLDQKQLKFFSLFIFELSFVEIDYYYFDDNCSYVLLNVLEVLDKDFQLTKDFWLYATPGDTIRTLMRFPDKIQKIHYRPSSIARFKYSFSELEPKEKQIFEKILLNRDEPPANIWAETSFDNDNQRIHVLDSLIDFIDYEEKLGGQKEAQKYATLRRWVLKERSSLKTSSKTVVIQDPKDEMPHLGHRAMRLGLGFNHTAGKNDTKTSLDLDWRPDLHDIVESPLGYTSNMHIAILDTTLRFQRFSKLPSIRKLEAINIFALDSGIPWTSKKAWELSLGYHEDEICIGSSQLNRRCQKSYFVGGKGLSHHIIPGKAILYGLLRSGIGFQLVDKETHPYLFPGIRVGMIGHFNNYISALLDYRLEYDVGKFTPELLNYAKINFRWTLNAEYSFQLGLNNSFKRVDIENGITNMDIKMFYYF